MNDGPPLITQREAAALLGTTARTVRRMVADGRLEKVTSDGGREMLARVAVLELRDRDQQVLLSYTDAARALGVTTKTVQRMVNEGRLDRVEPPVGRPQITQTSVIAALAGAPEEDDRGHGPPMSTTVLGADISGHDGREADTGGHDDSDADEDGHEDAPHEMSSTVPLCSPAVAVTPASLPPSDAPREGDALLIPLRGLDTPPATSASDATRPRMPRGVLGFAAAAFLVAVGSAALATQVTGHDRSPALTAAVSVPSTMSVTAPSEAVSFGVSLTREPGPAARRVEAAKQAAAKRAARLKALRRAEARRKAAARAAAERKRRERAAAAQGASDTTPAEPTPSPDQPNTPAAEPTPVDPTSSETPSECSAIYGGIGLC